jgi:hypothetical protein
VICPLNRAPLSGQCHPVGTLWYEHVFGVRRMFINGSEIDQSEMDAEAEGVPWEAMALDQAEADVLLAMEKHRSDSVPRDFPLRGERLEAPLISADRTERFALDIYRGRIRLSKVTYQNRVRKDIILARLDIDGPSHRNPDQAELPCPHLHLYREGYDDRWAFPLPDGVFTDLADVNLLCDQFMRYCNITIPPIINPSLL